jgi:CPA2 family monovalent cation:H+ antiporter-2
VLLAGALAIVLVAKPLVAFIVVWLAGYPLRTTLTVSIALAQIGEFSFILSTLGGDLGLLTVSATNVIVATAIVSIVLNPIVYRTIEPIERWCAAHPALWARLNRSPASAVEAKAPNAREATEASHRAIIVGYGPTGRALARLLRENDIVPTIVELNIDTVRALREEGADAIYGDAVHVDTLSHAGVATAGTMILTSAGMAHSSEVIRAARSLNPGILVLARAGYLRDLPPLKKAGADTVYSGEGEIALAFVETILNRLGATPEQIDRGRDRARGELLRSFETPSA